MLDKSPNYFEQKDALPRAHWEMRELPITHTLSVDPRKATIPFPFGKRLAHAAFPAY